MSGLPTLEQFTHVTARMAADDGVEGFLPTLVVPGEVRVIDEIPADVDHRDAIRDVVAALAGEECLFAVRSAEHEITTAHLAADGARFMRIAVTAGGLQVGAQPAPDWWSRRQ